MPLHHLHSREQADASLARFFVFLGHRPPSQHHEDAPRLIRPVRMVAPRLARQRRLALWSRTLDMISLAAVAGIACWVGMPVALTLIAGAL